MRYDPAMTHAVPAPSPDDQASPPAHLTPDQIAWLRESGIDPNGGFARLWGLYRDRIGFAPGEDENSPASAEWDAD